MKTNEKTEEFLEGLLEESEKNAEKLNDPGHSRMVNDVTDLLNRVKEGKYHDFHRNGEDAPKVSLVQVLDSLRQNVMSGKYDN